MTDVGDRLWQALDELERVVRAWDYPAAVRESWNVSDPDLAANLRSSAERNATQARENMLEGIGLCRGFLAADDERSAMECADRLVDRWERWTNQVSTQNAQAVQAQRPWWERWSDELDEWTRRAAAAAGAAADGLEQGARIGLAIAAAGALYLLSRR